MCVCTCTSSHKSCFSLLNEPPNESNPCSLCDAFGVGFSSHFLCILLVNDRRSNDAVYYFPKAPYARGYKQPLWQLLQSICLSACLAVSPAQHGGMHLLSPMGFGTFCHFHHRACSKWRPRVQQLSNAGRGSDLMDGKRFNKTLRLRRRGHLRASRFWQRTERKSDASPEQWPRTGQ